MYIWVKPIRNHYLPLLMVYLHKTLNKISLLLWAFHFHLRGCKLLSLFKRAMVLLHCQQGLGMNSMPC